MTMSTARDIDGGWAWAVLVASYVNIFLASGLCYVAGMFQVVFLQQFQGSVALTSWITALFSSMMQLTGPLSSVVVNCTNCRVAVMIGGACFSLGMVISGFADSLEFLLVSFGILAGIGLGLTFTASIVVINYFFDRRRAMVTGVALSATGLGVGLAPQISTYLMDNMSWREALVALGALAAQSCIAGAIMFPLYERKNQQCAYLSDKVTGCLLCIDRSDCEETWSANKISSQHSMNVEIVVEKVTQDQCETNDDVSELHYEQSSTRDRKTTTVHPDTAHRVTATDPLLLHGQKELIISDAGGQEVHVKLQPLSSPNSLDVCHLRSGSGLLPEVSENKALLPNKGDPHIGVPVSRKETDQRLFYPAVGSSISLDKTVEKEIQHLSNKHASQMQSHHALHKGQNSLNPRRGHFQPSQESLNFRLLQSDFRARGHKQSPVLNIALSHELLPTSHIKGSHDSLPPRFIVLARNQSLTSIAPSCSVKIFDPKAVNDDRRSNKIKSNTSLYSSNRSFRQGLEKSTANFKSSFMSVISVPLPQVCER